MLNFIDNYFSFNGTIKSYIESTKYKIMLFSMYVWFSIANIIILVCLFLNKDFIQISPYLILDIFIFALLYLYKNNKLKFSIEFTYLFLVLVIFPNIVNIIDTSKEIFDLYRIGVIIISFMILTNVISKDKTLYVFIYSFISFSYVVLYKYVVLKYDITILTIITIIICYFGLFAINLLLYINSTININILNNRYTITAEKNILNIEINMELLNKKDIENINYYILSLLEKRDPKINIGE